MKRESFYPKEDILDEIIRVYPNSIPDFLTFVGDGEPTLYRELGWLIRHVKLKLKIPVAVITNGSLLYRKDVRQDLENADVVIPSVDAGDGRLYNIINRPHRAMDFSAVTNGIKEFRRSYPGSLWIEVMLIKGLNDSREEICKINEAINKMAPDRVYLLTPIRPPAERWVSPSDKTNIMAAREIIGKSIPIVEYEATNFDMKNYDSARAAILNIGQYHPMHREQIIHIENHFDQRGTLEQMLKAGELIEIKYNGKDYLVLKTELLHGNKKGVKEG
jgi:wyosine [tRNA(Phe)-imidazoG37] synthetase (radical SAM superfamily)